jgi:protein involved in ribonucleotide reduction
MANTLAVNTATIGTLTTTTPLVSMTQSVVVVPANTADMDTGAQLLGTTASGNYSIGGHHVTTNGIISSTKISVPNVYTYVSGGNWYWDAEVSGSTSNIDETWTVNIVKYAPTVSTQSGVVAP